MRCDVFVPVMVIAGRDMRAPGRCAWSDRDACFSHLSPSQGRLHQQFLQQGLCLADYTGPCGETALGTFSAPDKEDFAWRCKASWACEDACVKDFSSCPSGWTAQGGGVCAAPSDYDGICSPSTRFETFSSLRKAEWAAMCSAKWPCA
jgi:CPW-WPC domain-containing protein